MGPALPLCDPRKLKMHWKKSDALMRQIMRLAPSKQVSHLH